MQFLKTKKNILLSLLTLVFIVISIPLILFNYKIQDPTKQISESIRSELLLFKETIPMEVIDKELSVLNNKKLDDKTRYQALLSIFYLFDNTYFNSGLPAIRRFASTLDEYASKNFKNDYKKEDFYIACADSECGEITPLEIEKILNDIKKLPVEEIYKNSISLNLRTASHVPYNNGDDFQKADKLVSYSLAYSQLISLNNSQASSSADELKQYIKKKYNQDL